MNTRSWRLGSWAVALGIVSSNAAAQPAAPPDAAPPLTPATPSPPETPAPVESDAGARPEPARAPTAPEPAPASPLPESSAGDPFSMEGEGGGMLLAGDGPKLELYGFADFSYLHFLGSSKNILRQFVAAYPSFYAGHLNLYLNSTLGDNWRSLAEVRFTYSPLGEEDHQKDGTFLPVDTNVTDYAELSRAYSWGGIEIQRIWIEYQPFDFLSLRAGSWFTPYGYWNDDHGSPTIITVHKPFPISDQIFPEKQAGLMAHGKYFVDSTALGYVLTLSNGRGPFDMVRDLDTNKAVGGRLFVETTALGNLTLGVDAYRGRYTASTKRYRIDGASSAPTVAIYRTVDSAYEELSLGADARFLWKDWHLQTELMLNDGAYDDAHRPATLGFDPRPAFAADYRRIGAYGLVGYRTPWLNLMPYAMFEHASYTNSDLAPPVYAWSGGINLRPTPSVVLKAELAFATFDGTGSTGLGADNMPYFGSQVAWAF